jgi:hypothetical protein
LQGPHRDSIPLRLRDAELALATGDFPRARAHLQAIQTRRDELTAAERELFEQLLDDSL